MTLIASQSPTPGCLPADTPDDVDIAALREKYRAERDKRICRRVHAIPGAHRGFGRCPRPFGSPRSVDAGTTAEAPTRLVGLPGRGCLTGPVRRQDSYLQPISGARLHADKEVRGRRRDLRIMTASTTTHTGTLHRAMPYSPDSGRLLTRTKLEGEEPFA